MNYLDIVTTFQSFPDNKTIPSSMPATVFPKQKGNRELVLRLQSAGHGIYWCINPQIDPTKRAIENTKEWACVGMDCDMIPQKELSTITTDELADRKKKFLEVIHNLEYKPTGIIESHKGFYPYWIFDQFLPITDAGEVNLNYRNFVKKLGDKIGYHSEGDSIARVLRVEGTLHLKNHNHPYKIKQIEHSGLTYQWKDLAKWIGFDTWIKKETPKEPIQTRDYKSIYDIPIMDALSAVSGTALVAHESYKFTKSGEHKYNMLINDTPSSNFIDIKNNSIGKTGGGATPNIVDWCMWYANQNMTSLTKENVRVALDAILMGSNFEARSWDDISTAKTELVDKFSQQIADNIWDKNRIMSAEIPKDRYLVDELIPRGCVFLSGAPKSLKSYISLHIIDCLSSGKSVFNKFSVPQKRKVLVMDRENQMWSVRERIEQIGSQEMNAYYLNVRTSFTNPEFREALLKYIKDNQYEVLFLDSFRRFYTGNENASELIADFFLFIDEVKATGCSVICIHHFNKNAEATGSSKIRGSSDIVAYYDANINFKKKLEGGVTILELEQTENRMDKESDPFTVNVIESEDNKLYFSFGSYFEPEQNAKDTAMKEIIKLLENQDGGGLYRDEIIKNIKGINSKSIEKALPTLEKQHRVIVDWVDRKKCYRVGTDLVQKEVNKT